MRKLLRQPTNRYAVLILHPLGRRRDDLVGGSDNIAGGPVVFDQMAGLGAVIRLEAPDELDRRARESIDVLIIIPDSEEAETSILVFNRAPGDGRDELIFLVTDVLVLIDQNPPIAFDQLLSLGFSLVV
jgi:hypothetical protein